MPIVKCPNCGRERLVVEGKKKKCRKCGTPLSALPAKPAKPAQPITAETIKEKYPTQVAEIIEEAKRELGIADDTVDEAEMAGLDTMTRRELIGYAAENGIEIDAKARKKKILAAIKDELSKPDRAAASE